MLNITNGQKLDYSKLTENSFLVIRPELFIEWDFRKNIDLDIYSITKGTHKRAWWKCQFCSREWETSIKSRMLKNTKCKTCSSKGLIKNITNSDFKPMIETAPKLIDSLVDKNIAKIESKNSMRKVDWKCSCGLIMQKTIKVVYRLGLNCPLCNDSFSFGERIVFHTLRESEVEFEWHKTFDWSDNKEYDFYLPELNGIIEVHGKQHYEASLELTRTFEEEQENDKLKEQLAKDNGIKHYIVINARESDFEFIFQNLTKSIVGSSIITIDSNKIYSLSMKRTINQTILSLWNENLTVKEISERTGIHSKTVSRTLKKYHEANLCCYDPYRSNRKRKMQKIYQYSKDYELIKVWDNYKELEKRNYLISSVSSCCNGKLKHYKNFIWSYSKLNKLE